MFEKHQSVKIVKFQGRMQMVIMLPVSAKLYYCLIIIVFNLIESSVIENSPRLEKYPGNEVVESPN